MPDSLVQLFVNPTAGRGRAGRRLSRIEALLAEAGVAFETHLSKDVGDLEQQVRDAVSGGADRIVVGGGDGSVHEAVNGIMAAGGSASVSASASSIVSTSRMSSSRFTSSGTSTRSFSFRRGITTVSIPARDAA